MSARWQKRILIALFLLFAFLLFAYQESLVQRAAEGEEAPDFQLEAADGTEWRLSEHEGSVIFLNFWTTWCDVCRAEIPALATFHERYKDQVLQVGVNWREPWPIIHPFMERYQMDYVTLRDPDGVVAKRYRLRGVPENWMIDESGVARLFWTGQSKFETLQDAFRKVTGRSIDEDRKGPFIAGEQALRLIAVRASQLSSHNEPKPILWLATTNGLYSSADGGKTWNAHPSWHQQTMTALTALTLPTSSAAEHIVVAASSEAGLKWSRDGGNSWEELTLPSGVDRVLGLTVSQTGQLYLAAEGPKFFQAELLNELPEWAEMTFPVNDDTSNPPFTRIHDIAFDGNQLVIAAGEEGMWSVSESGVQRVPLTTNQFTLSQRSTAGTSPTRTLPLPVYGLASTDQPDFSGMPRIERRGVWIASDTGIWRLLESDDRLPIGPINEKPARRFADVAPDPDRQERIWAVAPNGDLYVSENDGADWRWLPTE